MARVIRNCWVHRNPFARVKFLPRPSFGLREYDYEEAGATPDQLPQRVGDRELRLHSAPKLWLAWVYVPHLGGQQWWIRRDVDFLFGTDWKPGRMEVFKNTSEWNRILWRVKHLIEIRPLLFPDGEPSEADIPYTEILPSGNCKVRKDAQDITQILEPDDPAQSEKEITADYALKHTMRRWNLGQTINEDEVWADEKSSRI